MNAQQALPPGFEDLAPFLAHWDLSIFNERRLRRAGSSMEEIRRFYDAMTPRATAALDYLAQFPLDGMPESATCLCRLLLALPHAAVAVEMHRAPRIPFVPYPDNLTLARSFRHME